MAPKYRHYLKEWREARGLSQREVARRTGLAYGMICRYESDKRGMSLDVQFRLMAALELEPWQFFYPPYSRLADIVPPKAAEALEEERKASAIFGGKEAIPRFLVK